MNQKYSDMKENTVSARGQLNDTEKVRFINPNGTGKRILFVGNSITLHEPNESLGWYGSYGMAASSEDKDYVHIIIKEVLKSSPDAAFCICQVGGWEWQYSNGDNVLDIFSPAADFGADIIISRFVENCRPENANDKDGEIFKAKAHNLLKYLDRENRAQYIITTGFWSHPLDGKLIELAKEMGSPSITLGDLGSCKEMKAVGLFEHSGVASHPGDLGMEKIAERILTELNKML